MSNEQSNEQGVPAFDKRGAQIDLSAPMARLLLQQEPEIFKRVIDRVVARLTLLYLRERTVEILYGLPIEEMRAAIVANVAMQLGAAVAVETSPALALLGQRLASLESRVAVLYEERQLDSALDESITA